LQKTAN